EATETPSESLLTRPGRQWSPKPPSLAVTACARPTRLLRRTPDTVPTFESPDTHGPPGLGHGSRQSCRPASRVSLPAPPDCAPPAVRADKTARRRAGRLSGCWPGTVSAPCYATLMMKQSA